MFSNDRPPRLPLKETIRKLWVAALNLFMRIPGSLGLHPRRLVRKAADDTMRRLARYPAISRNLHLLSLKMTSHTRRWVRRIIYWLGAVIVGLVAIGFAKLATYASQGSNFILAFSPWLIFLIAPAGLWLARWLGMRFFSGAEGSGIPQTIVSIENNDKKLRGKLLSVRIAFGKIGITVLAIFSGASVGREGPTVQVGASIMYRFGRWVHLTREEMHSGLIMAGGAAGVAAAFNTPIAGVVFAIEELSRNFESRASGLVFTTVILAGITSWSILGNYHYFGHTGVALTLESSIKPVLLCGIVGGVLGGLFSLVLISLSKKGLPGRLGIFRQNRPLLFSAFCGLLIGVVGMMSSGATYGTGYEQVAAFLHGGDEPHWLFAPLKMAATIISNVSGIPGGIFAPSLAIGGGRGELDLRAGARPAGRGGDRARHDRIFRRGDSGPHDRSGHFARDDR